MKYLLDTDHISFLQKQRGPEYAALIARMAQHAATDFAFSIISFHEQVLGGQALHNRARTTARLVRSYAFLLEIFQSYTTTPILPFDAGASAVFAGLQAQRIRAGTMDLRIAAVALSQKLIRNLSEAGGDRCTAMRQDRAIVGAGTGRRMARLDGRAATRPESGIPATISAWKAAVIQWAQGSDSSRGRLVTGSASWRLLNERR